MVWNSQPCESVDVYLGFVEFLHVLNYTDTFKYYFSACLKISDDDEQSDQFSKYI